ncbi:MAG: CatA-like O-acetyltransferase [Rikenellaceae bacterium]
MGKQRIDIDNWKRKKKFEFFIEMLSPIYSFTVRLNLDNCYSVAKSHNRSPFIYYVYAIIKAANEIEELRLRVNREDGEMKVYLFDDVDLVTPIAVDDNGEFAEVRIKYSPDFEEFYYRAEQVIASASADMNPIVEYDPDATYTVVSALPFLDFTSMSPTIMDRGGVDQVPLITVGKMSSIDGHRSMPVALAVHHGFVDGYHIGQFFEIVQRTLDSYI